MSLTKRWLTALTIGALTCWLASNWCGNASECFYFAIPPVALAFYLSGVTDFRQSLRTQIRPALPLGLAVLLFGGCAVSLLFGPRGLTAWRLWAEVAWMVYLVAAMFILLMGLLRLLLAGGRLLTRSWPGGKVLGPVLALTMFAAVALPLGLAFSFVHRFKVPNLVDPRRDLGREYEEVEFASADGTTLRGWWIPARKPSTRTLVICHGLAANRAMTLPLHEVGDWLDANVFMFDMRGHGDSGGHTVTLGYFEKEDALAAIAYVRQTRPEQTRQLIGMGVSLGAAAMAQAAGMVEPALDGVILDSGFASTLEMTHAVLDPYPSFLHSWLLTVGLPLADLHAGCPVTAVRPETSIPRLRAPVVILHSRQDFMCPTEHSIRFYAQAAEPKQLHLFDTPGHCNGFFAHREEYHAAILAFAKQLR